MAEFAGAVDGVLCGSVLYLCVLLLENGASTQRSPTSVDSELRRHESLAVMVCSLFMLTIQNVFVQGADGHARIIPSPAAPEYMRFLRSSMIVFFSVADHNRQLQATLAPLPAGIEPTMHVEPSTPVTPSTPPSTPATSATPPPTACTDKTEPAIDQSTSCNRLRCKKNHKRRCNELLHCSDVSFVCVATQPTSDDRVSCKKSRCDSDVC